MRVLVVEDEKSIADDVTEALIAAGYVPEWASDGEAAWFKAETEDYAAIVLDLGLPKLDGLSVMRKLRGAGVKTPTIILTARGAWMERVEGIDAGADDYMAKPFHMEELVARLGALIRRASGEASNNLTAGRVSIDTRRMRVAVDERNVLVSPLEFRLLRYLMHHQGRSVPQFELAEQVYGSEQEPDSNALEVVVGRLRKKLGDGIIQTRRGYGYSIDASSA